MLTLTLQSSDSIPLEAESLRPDLLSQKSLAEIARLPLQHGNRVEPLGEHFHIRGDPSDGVLEILGDCSRIGHVARGMASGNLILRGNAGRHLGAEMSGGTITLHGDAGDWLGAEMSGGAIHVHGDAGNLVGAAYRGGLRGMRGGEILIDGNAGHEVGSTLRRGLIAIGGNCGEFAGVGMIAGSILVFGSVAGRPGMEMKRGTLAIFGPPPVMPPGFRFDCVYAPTFLTIYLAHLCDRNFAAANLVPSGLWKRFSGDMLSLGKGEILLPQH